ncbi:hypothetical protein PBOR_21965 [Paenibacillus borealis]|uniref:Prepilin type IV endopeptidase peptidase domain-containing protein n=1 Tax=Paenibacillus borealis TaxID=160799 RepID=A0A089LJI1_PAEBO|nr:hypothetical protein PBOR_21965 [Paenibacillus borealis]
MIYLLIVLYALLMGAAAIIKRRDLQLSLTTANLLGSLALLCTPFHPFFLLFGLIVLLGCALYNGYVLQGHIHLLHVLVRCVLSLCLYFSYTLL